MADVDSGKSSLWGHTTNALNYGHLGTATYEGGARRWSFLRRCVGCRPSESAFPFVVVKRETVYKISRNKFELNSDYLFQNPSNSAYGLHQWPAPLEVAAADIHEEEALSSAIITALAQYDPLFSDRLAFGSASCLLDNDVRSGYSTVPIAALVSGECGESITLAQIGKDRVIVVDKYEKDLVLKIPTITSNNHTSWTGSGETVLQICFAATSGYQSTWMAARLLSSTIIFHPLFHRRPVPMMARSSSPASGIRKSHLDANPVLNIPMSRTGGHPHADICFHPVDSHLLALIDQHGNWSTWKIEGKRPVTARTLFRIRLLRSGKLYTWENLRRPPQTDPYHDGWHKICWVADDSGHFVHVFLANRHDAVIYDSLAEERYPVNLSLGPARETQWILDVKKSALHQGWIFVLTSTRVLCVSTIKTEGRDIPMSDSHDILFSWQHFRGRRDITLSLTILEAVHCTIILMTSRINTIINVYRLDTSMGSPPIQVSWVEPCLLLQSDIGVQPIIRDATDRPLTLLIRPVQIQRTPKASDKPLTFSLNKLFILRADRTVSEVLLQDIRGTFSSQDHDSPNTIMLPRKSYLNGTSSKYAELDELDDFIVHESEDLLYAYPALHEGRDERTYRKEARPLLLLHSEVDFHKVCELVNQWSMNGLSRKRIHFDSYLQAIYPESESSVSTKPGVRLLSDLSSPLLPVTDVEVSSTTITSLAESSSIDGQGSSILFYLPGRLTPNTVLELYQSLVSGWLSGLPPEVPDRIRVNKERLARNIAADLVLAAIATRPAIHEPEMQQAQERIYPDSAPPVTVTSTASLDSTLADATVHSQPVSPHPSAIEEHPACARLRSYTTVSSNAVTTAIPAVVLDILAHIPSDAEADPSAYDWQVTEAAITAERNRVLEEPDPRERRRAEKLAQVKRRKTQLQMEAAEELVRQRGPPAIGSSQMVLPTREVQSSQVIAPERIESGDHRPMTQPERGTFGKRLGGSAGGQKNKGKRREAGFR